MLVYIIPFIITLICYKHIEQRGLFEQRGGRAVFIILFSVLIAMAACRENIGVDYKGYIVLYERIRTGATVNSELGFNLLCRWVQNTVDDYRVVFFIISLFTLVNFLVAIYDQSDDRVFSVFMFLALGYYNLTYNAIRYYYALSLVLLSYKSLYKKKYFKFVLIILVAALFHKTALIVIPLGIFLNNNVKRQYLYIALMAIGMLVFKNEIRNIAFHIYPSYLNTVYDGGSASIFNILKGLYIIGIGYIHRYSFEDEPKMVLYYKLNVFALVLYVCCSWLPELSRIGYYFNVTAIVFLASLFKRIQLKDNVVLLKITSFVLFSAYLVLMLQQADSVNIHLLPYETWLFKY